MEQEKRVRESTFTNKKNPFESTSWIDDNINYQQDDKRVIGQKGTKDNINNFIENIFKRDRNFRENQKDKWIQNDFIKLTRSFLEYDSGGGTRLLLNNEVGHEILKNITYSRGGTLPDFKTTSYKSVDVIEVNTTRNIPSR